MHIKAGKSDYVLCGLIIGDDADQCIQSNLVQFYNVGKTAWCVQCLNAYLANRAITGAQQPSQFWMSSVPPQVWLLVAKVLHEGAEKYGDWEGENHAKIPEAQHINHALAHIFEAGVQGSNPEEELSHAICRLLFALEAEMKEGA